MERYAFLFCLEKCWFIFTVFLLLNVLIWSILIIGIKIRTVLKSELDGLHENVVPKCLGCRENTKKMQTVLMDTLYIR